MSKYITKETTIKDVLNIIKEPKEINLKDLKNNVFVRKYITWDGEKNNLSLHYKSRFEKIKEANLKYPIIITLKNKKYDRLIDGHHRILKTILNKISTVRIRTVNLDGYSNDDARLITFLINALYKNTNHSILK